MTYEEAPQDIYDKTAVFLVGRGYDVRDVCHTKKEARRILKRHLSDVIYRRMIRDLAQRAADHPLFA